MLILFIYWKILNRRDLNSMNKIFQRFLQRRNREKDKLEGKEYVPQEEYYFFMKQLKRWLVETQSKEDKIRLLDFVIDIVKRDLQVDLLTEIFYKEEFKITNLTRSDFIPMDYIHKNGKQFFLQPESENRIVDLNTVVTIVIPLKSRRMKEALLGIKNKGFRYDSTNHSPALYFKELDLCYALQGNHSIASGIFQSTGEIQAKEYSIEPLFQNVRTDGLYWLNVHTNKPLKLSYRNKGREVFDFRVAVLYELVRKKYHLNKMEGSI